WPTGPRPLRRVWARRMRAMVDMGTSPHRETPRRVLRWAECGEGTPTWGRGGGMMFYGGPGTDGTTGDVPDPPAWTSPDEGSGEYDQRDPTLEDYANYELAELIAGGGDLTGK